MCGRLRVTVEGNTVSRGQKALEAPPPPAVGGIAQIGVARRAVHWAAPFDQTSAIGEGAS